MSRPLRPLHVRPTPPDGRAFWLLLVLLSVAAVRPAAGLPEPTATAPVTVRATATPAEVTIGDRFRYTVEVSAAADTEVLIPVLSGQLGDFSIVDFGDLPARRENGRTIITRWYTMSTFTTGDLRIPAPKVQYRLSGEGLQDAVGEEVPIHVASLLASDPKAADIRDIKGPEDPPVDWRPYAGLAAALVVLVLLAAGLYLALNRPRRGRTAPPVPAHEVALAALERVRRHNYIVDGQFGAYFVELSSIVRRYLEDGFRLRAPEMTTEEFLTAAATDQRLATAHRRLLADFLAQADLVKFARVVPTPPEAEAAYEAARRFVDDTRPDRVQQAAPEVRHAAA
jgi:hypothetical protein